MASLKWFSIGTIAGIIVSAISSIGSSINSSDQVNVIVTKFVLLLSGLAWYYGLLSLIIVLTPFLTFESLRKRIRSVKRADFIIGVAWGFAIAEFVLTVITHKSKLSDLELQTFNPQTISADVWVQIGLVVSTLLLAIITLYGIKKTHKDTAKSLEHTEKQLEYTKIQLDITRKELESRFRAELRLEELYTHIQQTNHGNNVMEYYGEFSAKLRNIGVLSANNIHVFWSDPNKSDNLRELVKEENNIKSKSLLIRGNIIPNNSSDITTIKIPLQNSNPFIIAIWITYDDSEIQCREFISVIKINGTRQFDVIGLYEKPQIDRVREELKK